MLIVCSGNLEILTSIRTIMVNKVFVRITSEFELIGACSQKFDPIDLIKMIALKSKKERIDIWSKNDRDLTQSYNKSPYANGKFKKEIDNTKNATKTSVT